jgi:hypothetical protein
MRFFAYTQNDDVDFYKQPHAQNNIQGYPFFNAYYLTFPCHPKDFNPKLF